MCFLRFVDVPCGTIVIIVCEVIFARSFCYEAMRKCCKCDAGCWCGTIHSPRISVQLEVWTIWVT